MRKTEYRLDRISGDLKLNGNVIAQLQNDHIHISLNALKKAGFSGDVEITDSWIDKGSKFRTIVKGE